MDNDMTSGQWACLELVLDVLCHWVNKYQSAILEVL